MRELPHPSLSAALVCDQAIQEIGTRKWSLIGIFNQIFTPQMPFTHPRLSLYFNLSDAEGLYRFAIELVSLDLESTVVGKIEGEVKCEDRLRDNEIGVHIANLVFPRYGKYAFRLTMAGKLVGEKSLVVAAPPPPQQGLPSSE